MVTLTVSALLLIVQLLFLKVWVVRANAEDTNEIDNGRQLVTCSAGKYLELNSFPIAVNSVQWCGIPDKSVEILSHK